MSEAKTKEEVREEFLGNVRGMVGFWVNTKGNTTKEKCEGVAFSILVLLDGGSSMPSMDIVMRPHPNDKEFHISEDEDYIEDGLVINDDVELHELFCK